MSTYVARNGQTTFIRCAKAETNYANRGMPLEDELGHMHIVYAARGIAQVNKQYIPTLPVKDGKWAKVIGHSTVDYTGTLAEGMFVAFDAKDVAEKRIPLTNLKPHQLAYLIAVNHLGGIAFVLVRFGHSRCYAIPIRAWEDAEEARKRGGRASFAEKDCKADWMVDGYDWARRMKGCVNDG